MIPEKLITPYKVPEGYFDSLPGIVMSRIKAEAAESAEEEMQVISPLLAGLPKKPVYSVPEGYFENLEIPILPRQAPVRRLHFWRYAAAAVVAGLIALAVWFAAMPPAESPALAGTSAVNGSGAILEKVATVSDAEIESFLGSTMAGDEFLFAALNGDIAADDIDLMLREISDAELETYLN